MLFFVVYQLLEGSLDFRVFGSFPIKNLDGSLHIAVYKILNSIWIFFLIVKIIGPRVLIRRQTVDFVNRKYQETIVYENWMTWGQDKWQKIASFYHLFFYLYGVIAYRVIFVNCSSYESMICTVINKSATLTSLLRILTFQAEPAVYLVLSIGFTSTVLSITKPDEQIIPKGYSTSAWFIILGCGFLLIGMNNFIYPGFIGLLTIPLVVSVVCYVGSFTIKSSNKLFVVGLVSSLLYLLLLMLLERTSFFQDMEIFRTIFRSIAETFYISAIGIAVWDTGIYDILSDFNMKHLPLAVTFKIVRPNFSDVSDFYHVTGDNTISILLIIPLAILNTALRIAVHVARWTWWILLLLIRSIVNTSMIIIFLFFDIVLAVCMFGYYNLSNLAFRFVPFLVMKLILPAIHKMWKYSFHQALAYALASAGLYTFLHFTTKYFLFGGLKAVLLMATGLCICLLGMLLGLVIISDKRLEVVFDLIVPRQLLIPFSLIVVIFIMISWPMNILSYLVAENYLRSTFLVTAVGKSFHLNPPGILLLSITILPLILVVLWPQAIAENTKSSDDRPVSVKIIRGLFLSLLILTVGISLYQVDYSKFSPLVNNVGVQVSVLVLLLILIYMRFRRIINRGTYKLTPEIRDVLLGLFLLIPYVTVYVVIYLPVLLLAKLVKFIIPDYWVKLLPLAFALLLITGVIYAFVSTDITQTRRDEITTSIRESEMDATSTALAIYVIIPTQTPTPIREATISVYRTATTVAEATISAYRTATAVAIEATSTTISLQVTASAQTRQSEIATTTIEAETQSTFEALATYFIPTPSPGVTETTFITFTSSNELDEIVPSLITINAIEDWQSTGLFIREGQLLRVEAYNKWSFAGSLSSNAEGVDPIDHSENVMQGCRHAALIARTTYDLSEPVMSELMCIYSSYLEVVNQTGFLEFRINDLRTEDNSGIIYVLVWIYPEDT